MYAREHTHTISSRTQASGNKVHRFPRAKFISHKVHEPKLRFFNHRNPLPPLHSSPLHPVSLTLHSIPTGLVSWFLSPQQTEGSNYAGNSEKGLQRREKKRKTVEICQHSPPPERNP